MNHSTERIEGFSDAVFAFAATLLVVSLEVPENFSELKDIMSGFLSFGVSFLALVLIWRVHYNFFRRTTHIDNVIISLNMLFLFVVLFYVFPLKFMTGIISRTNTLMDATELQQLFIIYSLGFALIFAVLAGMYFYASKKEKENKRILKFYSEHFGLFVIIAILSILLAVFNIGIRYGIPGFAYPFLGPVCYFYGRKYYPDIKV